MKKIQLTKGLQINKEAIGKLQAEQLNDVKGGLAAAGYSCGYTSNYSCPVKQATV